PWQPTGPRSAPWRACAPGSSGFPAMCTRASKTARRAARPCGRCAGTLRCPCRSRQFPCANLLLLILATHGGGRTIGGIGFVGAGVSFMADLLSDLTPAQCEAVTHFAGPLLILAGAGSGKTRVITRRVAWLLEQGVRLYSILAITFTNKAAGEMRQRVEALVPNSRVWIS